MPNFLYFKRGFSPAYYGRKVKISNAMVSRAKDHLLWFAGEAKRRRSYAIIDAFFEASLHAAGNVKEVSHTQSPAGNFDAVVVNYRSRPVGNGGDHEFLMDIGRRFDSPTCLFIDDDMPETLVPEKVLDCFDIIFKREPFIDLDRYDISYENKKKIRPTMLGCPFFDMRKKFEHQLRDDISELRDDNVDKQYDVFFSGIATIKRERALAALNASGFDVGGGLQAGIIKARDLQLKQSKKADRLKLVDYASKLKQARLSLVVAGYGPFTFRHLEVLALGELALSDASLLDLWLPIELKEGHDLLVYHDEDDLVDKVRFALDNSEAAHRIAAQGNATFRRSYDARIHGEFIRQALGV